MIDEKDINQPTNQPGAECVGWSLVVVARSCHRRDVLTVLVERQTSIEHHSQHLHIIGYWQIFFPLHCYLVPASRAETNRKNIMVYFEAYLEATTLFLFFGTKMSIWT